jgi:hypothetical protein
MEYLIALGFRSIVGVIRYGGEDIILSGRFNRGSVLLISGFVCLVSGTFIACSVAPVEVLGRLWREEGVNRNSVCVFGSWDGESTFSVEGRARDVVLRAQTEGE